MRHFPREFWERKRCECCEGEWRGGGRHVQAASFDFFGRCIDSYKDANIEIHAQTQHRYYMSEKGGLCWAVQGEARGDKDTSCIDSRYAQLTRWGSEGLVHELSSLSRASRHIYRSTPRDSSRRGLAYLYMLLTIVLRGKNMLIVCCVYVCVCVWITSFRYALNSAIEEHRCWAIGIQIYHIELCPRLSVLIHHHTCRKRINLWFDLALMYSRRVSFIWNYARCINPVVWEVPPYRFNSFFFNIIH